MFNRYTLISFFCVFLFAMFPLFDATEEPQEPTDSSTVSTPAIIELHLSEEAIHRGNLILVNEEHPYPFSTWEREEETHLEQSDLEPVDEGLWVQPQLVEALDRMQMDLLEATAGADVTVIDAYRTEDPPTTLTGEDPGRPPEGWSYSEHPTGYAVDFGVWQGGEAEPIGWAAASTWLEEQGATYGFLLRYPKEKADITGVDGVPWHFRYVGMPHAMLMREMDYCLEEYIEWLRGYPWDQRHLQCTVGEEEYEIYFVPAEDGITVVPVPDGVRYTLSGNNVDGFIVTLMKG